MRTWQRLRAVAAVLLALAATVFAATATGCSQQPTARAEFVRYVSAPDGSRLALVRPFDADRTERTVQCRLSDLRPGDVVLVTNGSNDWDQPQWMPTQAIVSRASER